MSAEYTLMRKHVMQACASITSLVFCERQASGHAHGDGEGQAEDILQILDAAKRAQILFVKLGSSLNNRCEYSMPGDTAPQSALMPLLSEPDTTYHHLKELSLSAP